MTTIAANRDEMSADSLMTAGDTIVGRNVKKLFRLSDGTIVGCAGQVSDIQKFLAWLEDGQEDSRPPKAKEMSALLLYPNGDLKMFEDGVLMPEEAPAAIGTGHISALTAMDMGANTATAVRMAIKRDVFSGGRVVTMKRLPNNL